MSRRKVLLITAGAVSASCTLAIAADIIVPPEGPEPPYIHWVGYQNNCMVTPPGFGSFFDGDNWWNFAVPGTGELAIFGSGFDPDGDGFPTTVHFGNVLLNVFACPVKYVPGGDASVEAARVEHGNWTFDFDRAWTGSVPPPPGAGSLTTEFELVVGGHRSWAGTPGTATLNVRLGSITSGWCILGELAGSSGTLQLHGSTAGLDCEDNIVIGAYGTGILTVASGAQVATAWSGTATEPFSVGSLLVDGPESVYSGSLWHVVGVNGSGSLSVTNGALIQSQGANVGEQPGSTGNALVTGAGSMWSTASAMNIGLLGSGSMTIEDGGRVSSFWGNLGTDAASADGQVFIRSGGSWSISDHLVVGDSGTGFLSLDGGTLESGTAMIGEDGGTGAAEVRGSTSVWESSVWIDLGMTGHGSLSILDGGSVVTPDMWIGTEPTGSGDLIVRGSGSTLVVETDELLIGRRGHGVSTIDQGGTVTCSPDTGPLVVGLDGSGVLIVDGVETSLRAEGAQIQVGSRLGSSGSMTVSDGGYVFSTRGGSTTESAGVVGGLAGASGEVLVTGTGSLWENADGAISVGFGGQGTLVVEAGGEIRSVGGEIGRLVGSFGNVILSGAGSAWNSTDVTSVGAGGTGALAVENLAALSATTLSIGAQGTVSGDATIIGVVKNKGRIEPGAASLPLPGLGSISTLSIDGNFNQSTGALVIELGGLNPGTEHDVLAVTGTATLAGTLELRAVNGFVPEEGMTFDVLTATGGITGSFDAVSGYTVTYADGVARVVVGNGDIAFDPPVAVAAINEPAPVGSIDFDGDGHNDIALPVHAEVTTEPGVLSIFLNDGTGVSYTQVDSDVGVEPSGVVIGDFDGTSGPDVAVCNAGDDSVFILLNDGLGSGTFLPPQIIAVGARPVSIDAGDLNADGSIDLVIANRDDDTLTLLANDGSGVFTVFGAPIAVGDGPAAVRFAPLFASPMPIDALDLIVANELDSTIFVLDNDGAGGFAQVAALPAPAGPTFIDPDDFDDDKQTDFGVAGTGAGVFSTYLADGAGGFERTDFEVGAAPASVDGVDLDGDGDLDVLVVADVEGTDDRAVRVLRSELNNVGEFEFTLIDDLAPDPAMRFALASLLDGDQRPDVIAVSGEGERGEEGALTVILNTTVSVAGDVNGDGVVDVTDLLAILSGWGACPAPPTSCPADLNGDGQVGVSDLLAVLAGWTG